jgi:hypothetical protein
MDEALCNAGTPDAHALVIPAGAKRRAGIHA